MIWLYVAPLLFTFISGVILVRTQHLHGHLSLDSTLGIQKLHISPTPRIGGLAIFAGLCVADALASGPVREILLPMSLAGMPAFVAGLVEDLTKCVSVRVRLLATMGSGLLVWALTGIAMQRTGLWGLDDLLAWLPLAVAFTAFVVSGVANATNIIDGFNGLAAGVVAIMLTAMGVIALGVGDLALCNVAFALAAVAVAFVAVNWPWGKIFLGDGGAYLLGFLVAWIAILLPMRNPGVNGWATLMACAYPVLEVLFSIRRRVKRQGHHPGEPDTCHLHHFLHRRLIRKWFPKADRTLQNGLTGSLAWVLACLPALWAIVYYENTPILVAGFFLSAFGYAAVYARLTQFVWCFQAATMRRRNSIPAA